MLVGAQCDISYTEHTTPSNHQPVARVFTTSAACPMSCAQLLTANSKRRKYTYTRSTVRASRRTRDEALLSLAVLKMTGKWFGRRTRVGALLCLEERVMFYRGSGGGDWWDETLSEVKGAVNSVTHQSPSPLFEVDKSRLEDLPRSAGVGNKIGRSEDFNYEL